jgi:hypothetical protein
VGCEKAGSNSHNTVVIGSERDMVSYLVAR